MNKLRLLIFPLLFLFLSHTISAQFTLEAQIRPRFEMRDGYQRIAARGSTPAFFISQRTRLSFVYNTEKLKVRISPQDVRVWGDEQQVISTGVFGDYASLDLFEGYAEMKTGKSVWISIGRQPIFYDGERIFSPRNWNQNGMTYDALILKISPGDWNLHIGTSWNSTGENNSDNFYPTSRIKTMNYLWLSKTISEQLRVSLFHLAAGRTLQNTGNAMKFRQTSGVFMDSKFKDAGFLTGCYYQSGKNVTGVPVSAMLFDAEFNYKTKQWFFGINTSYLSGNKCVGDKMNIDHLFDIYYGSRVRYFGGNSYFRDIAIDTGEGGLSSYGLYADYKINDRMNIRNTGRYVRLAELNSETPPKRNLGFENDLILKYLFSEWGTLDAGYYFFLPTQSMKILQKVPDARLSQFIFVQLTILPTLFR